MDFLRVRWFGAMAFIVLALIINANLTSTWYSVSRPPLLGQPDIPVVILRYFSQTREMVLLWNDLLYGKGLQGSSIYVRYLLIPFFLLPLLYIAQTIIHRKYPKTRDYTLLYTSPAFLIFTEIWILLTATVNGIAQTEGWYWAKWPLNGGFIEVPGTADILTHFMAGGIFITIAYNFAVAQWFGIDRLIRRFSDNLVMKDHVQSSLWFYRNLSNACELFDDFVAWAITYGVSVWFESVEALHPEDYGTWTNLRGNSYSDLIAACFFALMFMAFVYRFLVPKQVREYVP